MEKFHLAKKYDIEKVISLFNEKITMTELYKQLAYEFMTNENCIERSLRTASKTAYKNIQEYFNYDNKITNKAILQLFRFYEDRRKNE